MFVHVVPCCYPQKGGNGGGNTGKGVKIFADTAIIVDAVVAAPLDVDVMQLILFLVNGPNISYGDANIVFKPIERLTNFSWN